jgi:hypothetical protein
MAKYEVEFDRDGRITIRDAAFIRRLKMLLRQDQRLLLAFTPDDPDEITLIDVKCPPIEKCPAPEDAMCPIYLKDVRIDIRNQWVWDKSWDQLGKGDGRTLERP